MSEIIATLNCRLQRDKPKLDVVRGVDSGGVRCDQLSATGAGCLLPPPVSPRAGYHYAALRSRFEDQVERRLGGPPKVRKSTGGGHFAEPLYFATSVVNNGHHWIDVFAVTEQITKKWL